MKDRDVDSPKILSLFSGIGGLDEGVRLALPRARVLAYVEREAYAAACLLARMEEGSMEPAPVWCGKIERLDVAPFVGAVDLVTAGFPCPGNSIAGKRLGIADPRWLWPHVLRIAVAVRARAIFFENPRGLLSVNDGRAFATILGDLAGAGFDAEWAVLSAKQVGASHERQRIFCLARSVADSGDGFVPFTGRGPEGRNGTGSAGEAMAHAIDRGYEVGRTEGDGEIRHRTHEDLGPEIAKPSGEMADASRDGRGEGRPEPEGEQRRPGVAERGGDLADSGLLGNGQNEPQPIAGGGGTPDDNPRREELAHPECQRPQEREGERGDGEQEFASAVGSLPLFAPGPNDPRWRDIPEFLWPSTEPSLRCVVAGVPILLDPARAHQIRCVGNSCGILQAAAAFVGLVRRSS